MAFVQPIEWKQKLTVGFPRWPPVTHFCLEFSTGLLRLSVTVMVSFVIGMVLVLVLLGDLNW